MGDAVSYALLRAMVGTAALVLSGFSPAAGGGAKTSPPSEPDPLRAELTRAWEDATGAWRRMLGDDAYGREVPHLNFVPAVRPSHCYGLYVGAGPVYCFGNSTVFVSLEEMKRLAVRFGGAEPAGLAFLVAHELGHHVQKATGRFRVLAAMMRAQPRSQRELITRFELEADCLAGVWAGNSSAFAADANVRRTMLATIAAIGDDKMAALATGPVDPSKFTHGTSDQRQKWYKKGLESGAMSACRVLEADAF
ncbi:MAG: neutral zinc metallopeptidase [Hyphomicrobium sp.]